MPIDYCLSYKESQLSHGTLHITLFVMSIVRIRKCTRLPQRRREGLTEISPSTYFCQWSNIAFCVVRACFLCIFFSLPSDTSCILYEGIGLPRREVGVTKFIVTYYHCRIYCLCLVCCACLRHHYWCVLVSWRQTRTLSARRCCSSRCDGCNFGDYLSSWSFNVGTLVRYVHVVKNIIPSTSVRTYTRRHAVCIVLVRNKSY